MSSLFTSLSNIIPSSPRTGGVELPTAGADEPLIAPGDKQAIEQCTLQIDGMTCGACVESIEGMLRPQPGIFKVQVALLAKRGVIDYDPRQWTPEKLISEIEDIGFDAAHLPPVRADEVTLRIYGMTCGSCTSTVEKGLAALPGVTSVAVSLASETCKVRFETGAVGPRQLVEAIEDMGFDAMLADTDDSTQVRSLTRAKEIHEWRRRFLLALALAVPVFFVSMVAPHIPFLHPIAMYQLCRGIYVDQLIAFVLTTPAQLWLGHKFTVNAWKSVHYTDVPACTREKRVPTELVQVGDTVKLVPGERIPADGRSCAGPRPSTSPR